MLSLFLVIYIFTSASCGIDHLRVLVYDQRWCDILMYNTFEYFVFIVLFRYNYLFIRFNNKTFYLNE